MKKRIDPRTALFAACVAATLAVVANRPVSAHATFAFSALLAFAFGARRFALLSIATYLAAHLLSESAWILGGPASVAFVMFAYMAQKLLVFMLIGAFTSRTTTLEGIGAALSRLRAPRAIALPTMVIFRFMPTLRSDARALVDSLKTRGVIVSSWSLLPHPGRWIELVMVPLLMRAAKASDELSASGLTRGLGLLKSPDSVYPMGFGGKDLALAVSVLVLVAIVVQLQIQAA